MSGVSLRTDYGTANAVLASTSRRGPGCGQVFGAPNEGTSGAVTARGGINGAMGYRGDAAVALRKRRLGKDGKLERSVQDGMVL
jgi:hypothetical protein